MQLESTPEASRSTHAGRRDLPKFASKAERLDYYERHRLESEQAWLDSNDPRAGRETPRERRARMAAARRGSSR